MTILDIFLDRVEPDGIVVGTNNSDDIPVGTIFTELATIRVEGEPAARTATELSSTPISLHLMEAVIYRKSVAVVPRGWPAGLRLKGTGLEAIRDALGDKRAAEFVHLRTVGAA